MRRTPAHRRRRIASASLAAAALAAAGTLGAAASHGATTPPSAVCTNTFTATIAPGFTPKPGAGKLTSNGQTGTIECFGTIGGARVTGPGTLGFVERHRAGAAAGTPAPAGSTSSSRPRRAPGTWSARLPSAAPGSPSA